MSDALEAHRDTNMRERILHDASACSGVTRGNKKVRIIALGIRGVPNVPGGVETHAERLYERLAQLGCEVEILVRTPFVPRGQQTFGTIKLRRIWAPKWDGVEALVHSVLGVLYAAWARPDILHIHAIGPALCTPLARMLGLRVIVTHHGQDYERAKWGAFARWVLRTGEAVGMRHSHARISISQVIAELVRVKYGCDSDLVRNGVAPTIIRPESEHVRRFNLEPGEYFLQVSRLVPEKRQLDLIRAYALMPRKRWKLVLVGDGSPGSYRDEVREAAAAAGVVLTGSLSGVPLQQMFSHAGAFILPSSHEGLPIALLEAMSYGLPVLASDIPANLEIGLGQDAYYELGNAAELAARMQRVQDKPPDASARDATKAWVTQKYNWDTIASETLEIYRRVQRLSARPLPYL